MAIFFYLLYLELEFESVNPMRLPCLSGVLALLAEEVEELLEAP